MRKTALSCQRCSVEGRSEGYDCSDILRLQRDLSQAKKLAEKRKVLTKWTLRYYVRSERHREIYNWKVRYEPYADEAEIFEDRKYQCLLASLPFHQLGFLILLAYRIIGRLRAVEGITEAAIGHFMAREDKYHKRLVLQPRLHYCCLEWDKIGPRLILSTRPPPQTRSKQPRDGGMYT